MNYTAVPAEGKDQPEAKESIRSTFHRHDINQTRCTLPHLMEYIDI